LAQKKKEFCPETLTCIAMLATAVGPALRSYMEELLGEMFNSGLSATLTASLKTLAKHIPGNLSQCH
jgi:FKBP12-rapamycin complex-associated protein